jgi:hypothetical protein
MGSHLDYFLDVTAQQLADENRQIERALDSGMPFLLPTLRVKVAHPDGEEIDYGIVSHRSVTNAGAAWLASTMLGVTDGASMRWHGMGTDDRANTALSTGLYAESNYTSTPTLRYDGGNSQSGDGRTYGTYADITSTASQTICEHGIFDQQMKSVPATLLDRTAIPAGIPLVTSSVITFNYELTFIAGG